MTAFLLGIAAGLYLALALWWIEGMHRDRKSQGRLDRDARQGDIGMWWLRRKPRREVRPVRGRSASPPCGAAGTETPASPEIHAGAPRRSAPGGPTG